MGIGVGSVPWPSSTVVHFSALLYMGMVKRFSRDDRSVPPVIPQVHGIQNLLRPREGHWGIMVRHKISFASADLIEAGLNVPNFITISGIPSLGIMGARL